MCFQAHSSCCWQATSAKALLGHKLLLVTALLGSWPPCLLHGAVHTRRLASPRQAGSMVRTRRWVWRPSRLPPVRKRGSYKVAGARNWGSLGAPPQRSWVDLIFVLIKASEPLSNSHIKHHTPWASQGVSPPSFLLWSPFLQAGFWQVLRQPPVTSSCGSWKACIFSTEALGVRASSPRLPCRQSS